MAAFEDAPLARRLRAEIRGEVMFDRCSRGRYATDASIYQMMPLGVVVPRGWSDATATGVCGACSAPGSGHVMTE